MSFPIVNVHAKAIIFMSMKILMFDSNLFNVENDNRIEMEGLLLHSATNL